MAAIRRTDVAAEAAPTVLNYLRLRFYRGGTPLPQFIINLASGSIAAGRRSYRTPLLQAELFLPEVGVLDAERFGVECVFLDARFALRFIVFECLYGWPTHEKQDQYCDYIEPGH